MTNQEALAAFLLIPVPDNALVLALTNRESDPEEQYTVDEREGVEKALMDVLVSVMTNPDITEGGYSIKNPDREKIKFRILALATKYSEQAVIDQFGSATPTIRRASIW